MELGFELTEEMAAKARKSVERLQCFAAAKRGRFNQVETIRGNPHETVVIRSLDGGLVDVIHGRMWDAALSRFSRRYAELLRRVERRMARLSATRERMLREWIDAVERRRLYGR